MRRFFAALIVLVAAGCGGLEERAVVAGPSGHVAAERVSVPEPRLAYEPTPEGKARGGIRPALDTAAIGAHAVRLFHERGTANAVATVTSGTGVATLEVSVESASVKYEGQTGIMPVKVVFVVCFFPLDFPNYFIASDRYALHARAHWRLFEPATGRVLGEGEVEAKQPGVFGDLSRGWYFLGFVRAPQCLDDDSWREVAETLRPGCEEALAEAVVVAAESASAGPRDGTAVQASGPRRD